jgi:hypothetical protein
MLGEEAVGGSFAFVMRRLVVFGKSAGCPGTHWPFGRTTAASCKSLLGGGGD